MKITLERIMNVLLLGIVYIHMNIAGLLYSLRCIVVGRGSPYTIIHYLASLLSPRYTCVKGSKPIRGGKTMYFLNHRSWADFFVDGDMISGCSYLSRMAVVFAFPGACLSGYINRFIWFFKRQRGISRDWFTSFFKENWDVRPNHGVIVYPEGHRYKGEGSLSLKTGVMEVAFKLKTPCQIVLSNGKENLMDEISLKINRNSLVTVCVSDILDPTKFDSLESWFDYVNEQWKQTYSLLHSSESDGVIFSGPLPGVKKESLVEETLPTHRRFVAASYAIGLLAIIILMVKMLI